MCKGCVREETPRRGDFCADGGALLPNLRPSCAGCGDPFSGVGGLAALAVRSLVHTGGDGTGGEHGTPAQHDHEQGGDSGDEDEWDEEVVKFEHCCGGCGHVVGVHVYRCEVGTRRVREVMRCRLCGRGASDRPILPDDYATDIPRTEKGDSGVVESRMASMAISGGADGGFCDGADGGGGFGGMGGEAESKGVDDVGGVGAGPGTASSAMDTSRRAPPEPAAASDIRSMPAPSTADERASLEVASQLASVLATVAVDAVDGDVDDEEETWSDSDG